MKNIGEKLEQARNARGFTLKDAVAYTKIKQEFLVSMENNDFSFNLPDVYRRGFLRLYSDYLKLDTEEIMQEYKAMQGNTDANSHINLLDKIAKSDSMLSNDALNNVVEADVIDTSERFDADKDYFDAPPSPLECDSKFNYIKIALIASSVFLGVLIVFFLIRAIIGSSEEEAVASEATMQAVSPVTGSFLLTLSTKPNKSTRVMLYYPKQESKPIYDGLLNAGESRDFEINNTGALLSVIDAENLRIFKNAAAVNLPSTLKGPQLLRVNAP